MPERLVHSGNSPLCWLQGLTEEHLSAWKWTTVFRSPSAWFSHCTFRPNLTPDHVCIISQVCVSVLFQTDFLMRVPKIAKRGSYYSNFSVLLFFCIEQLGFQWTNFYESWYLRIFWKSVTKIQVSLNSDKNNGYLSWSPIQVFEHLSLNSS